jgi:hypothetical protein
LAALHSKLHSVAFNAEYSICGGSRRLQSKIESLSLPTYSILLSILLPLQTIVALLAFQKFSIQSQSCFTTFDACIVNNFKELHLPDIRYSSSKEFLTDNGVFPSDLLPKR